jgi:hypothetical protein
MSGNDNINRSKTMAVKFNADNKSKECFTDAPVYSVKGVKSFQGREGMGFECSVYKDGKRLGTVTDVCNGGGQLQMNLKTREDEAELEAYCKTLPQLSYMNDGKEHFFNSDPCIFIGGLVDAFETDQRNKRNCKTKTLVEVVEDGKKVVYAYKCKFSLAIKKQIKDRDYPNTDIVFINERYLHEKYK